jgi:hypothetical protein
VENFCRAYIDSYLRETKPIQFALYAMKSNVKMARIPRSTTGNGIETAMINCLECHEYSYDKLSSTFMSPIVHNRQESHPRIVPLKNGYVQLIRYTQST